MKFLILILVSIFVLGCGEEVSYVEPELQPYFQEFLTQANSFGYNLKTSNLVVEKGVLPNNKAGRCKREKTRYVDGVFEQKTVIINPNFWDNATEAAREFVMFHELGHCLLSLGHDMGVRPLIYVQHEGETKQVSIAASLMSSATNMYLDDEIYEQIRPYYLERMFIGKSNLLEDRISSKVKSQKVQTVSKENNFHFECNHSEH